MPIAAGSAVATLFGLIRAGHAAPHHPDDQDRHPYSLVHPLGGQPGKPYKGGQDAPHQQDQVLTAEPGRGAAEPDAGEHQSQHAGTQHPHPPVPVGPACQRRRVHQFLSPGGPIGLRTQSRPSRQPGDRHPASSCSARVCGLAGVFAPLSHPGAGGGLPYGSGPGLLASRVTSARAGAAAVTCDGAAGSGRSGDQALAGGGPGAAGGRAGLASTPGPGRARAEARPSPRLAPVTGAMPSAVLTGVPLPAVAARPDLRAPALDELHNHDDYGDGRPRGDTQVLQQMHQHEHAATLF